MLPDKKLDATRFSSNAKKAFTLIELLVTISIIAVLVAIGTASLTNTQQKGRDGKRKTDLKGVQQALEQYFQANAKYPDTNSGQIRCNFGGDTTTIAWGNAFTCNSVTYMAQLPKDPKGLLQYYYHKISDFSYNIAARLENTNDPDLIGLPDQCSSTPSWGGSNYNYCAIQQ